MPNEIAAFGRVVAWRIGIGLAFAVTWAAARASQDAIASASGSGDTYIAFAEKTPDQMDAGNGLRTSRVGSVSVSDVSDQTKRQDLNAAGKSSIAVLYPDIGPPYNSIFAKIIEGIEGQSQVRVISYAVGSGIDVSEITALFKRNGARIVIALGRQGLKAATALDRDLPVVVGGVLTVPDAESRNLTGITLTPDPALLFARLKSLMPNVRRVLVIYNSQHNDWLIRLARDAARVQGLELVAQEARDLASAARLYEAALVSADGRRDALWLPQDPTTVDEGTVLPLVLKESWSRNVPFFSSSYLHVKKGALFALYPNNLELGRTLASTAMGLLAGESRKRGMAPLREMHMGVNLRAAGHMGLSISYQQQRSFDYIFPEP